MESTVEVCMYVANTDILPILAMVGMVPYLSLLLFALAPTRHFVV